MYEPLTTIERLRLWLKITDDSDDALLGALIESCSEQIGRYCSRDNLGSVESYNETYWFRSTNIRPLLVLDHWPVVSISQIKIAGADVAVVTDPMQAGIGGAFLDRDARTLRLPPVLYRDTPVQIAYTAGFDPLDLGLEQICCQFTGEVYKSKDWIGYSSKSLAGETVSFQSGTKFGMSPRTVAMLEPYKNRMMRSG